jgi:phosphohistidine swiveling domain-containing protein
MLLHFFPATLSRSIRYNISMLTLPLSSPDATLDNAGGKGASLARLVRLGLPVPPGFLLTTEAYRRYITAYALDGVISSNLAGLSSEDPDGLERASSAIRIAFSAGNMSQQVGSALMDAYHRLDPASSGVAVRSSATTEDLPDLSFAGQQETYLNVVGEAQLRKAVVDCWSSLWTARAIGYRLRNGLPQQEAALAVVVQRMVYSQASGVLFTANPLTGLLSEMVIDAAFGLGEALVSGQVEPDHYVVDALSGELRTLTLGGKGTATRAKAGGGVENVQEMASDRQVLSPEKVRRLAEAGRRIQAEYGSPQDIEWAYVGDDLYILQSRPVTSLYPVPAISFDPLIAWFSFAAVQGIVGPMTPLGQEAAQRVVVGVGKKVGAKVRFEDQDILVAAGERLWIRIDDLLRNPLGSRILWAALGIVEPGTRQVLQGVVDDPRFSVGKGKLKYKTLRRMFGYILPALLEMPRTLLQPEKARGRFDARLETYLRSVSIPGGVDRFERLANAAAFLDAQGGLADALPMLLPLFMPVMATSLIALNLIAHLLPPDEAGRHPISMAVLEITRALPGNVTTQMDLALWKAATRIKEDPDSRQAFRSAGASALAGAYLSGSLPSVARSLMADFLSTYGMRGVGEIDLGRPRWREDPTSVLRTLQDYLEIPPEAAPDLVFERSARAADAAVERLAAEARRQRGGWFKEKLVLAAARRVRLLLGGRESPKFYAIRAMDIVRSTLLAIGRDFVEAGMILDANDLFFLHVSELAALARREQRDWKVLIAGRRQVYDRELRRRQVPRLLISDGRTFYEGIGAGSDSPQAITGSPVSPGVVEGRVRVVFDPRRAHLEQGDILVCPGTDPAWTPLFMTAGGLVMEVGGMMTHGSVVAREYGIPAVVGVHQATQRLKDGQRIRLDGSTGKIVLL